MPNVAEKPYGRLGEWGLTIVYPMQHQLGRSILITQQLGGTCEVSLLGDFAFLLQASRKT